MEDFEFMIEMNQGSYQTLPLPSHFAGKNWGVYVESFPLLINLETSLVTINTSWDYCAILMPYIFIKIDSPTLVFDYNSKPTNILDVIYPTSQRTNNSRTTTRYEIREKQMPIITPIFNQQQITIAVQDPEGVNLVFGGTNGNRFITYNGVSTPYSGGLLTLRFVKLN